MRGLQGVVGCRGEMAGQGVVGTMRQELQVVLSAPNLYINRIEVIRVR